MNYKKIGQQLLKENYIDERMLVCHSYRSYTSTKDNIIYSKFTKVSNRNSMPSFMLLSIKDDVLNISYAKAFGGFKKYYAQIKLERLLFIEKKVVDKMVDVYIFDLFDETGIKEDNFFIISIKGKKETQKLVDAINNYVKKTK